ncbi:5-(carboxyamino)imidazole ribonucleotide mutase [Alienimonas californiensis]|uniref:N5-carboxyaminoimidazole ribonucleotide mutase n=1 Tax=Alienimonas californiensis TaxID=2527989 RepID=A0A517PBV6_9PLAN|nr:5-(carboxyamino)imidazole ribonucleotide mutase [Alienimonas californiensis]QDT16865.1 N5-carboxyaminoimidazole ribonucleotide mutase [Alienimonas californiensis]
MSDASPPAPLVGVVMGSRSDLPTMRAAAEILRQFDVLFEAEVVSAHRTPDRLVEYATEARGRGLKVIIAGAGGAAHLPGMLAASTTLPVFGVPVQSRALSGLDSLLSIVQMPGGVPVGTLAIGASGAKNAALLAVRVLALSDEGLAAKLAGYHAKQTATVTATRVLTDDDLFPPASSPLDHG